MKKVFIACFLAIIMLMVPVTTATKIRDTPKIDNISTVNDDLPQIYITEQQNTALNNYIETNFEEEDKEQATNIKNDIIASDLEVNLIELSDKLDSYGYQPIPQHELDAVANLGELNLLINKYWSLTENLFADFINKIVEFIKDRLGWFYQLFVQGVSLFDEGVQLIIDGVELISNLLYPPVNLLIVFVIVANEILFVPHVFSESIKKLFQLELDDFVDTVEGITEESTQDLDNLVDTAQIVIDGAEEIFESLKDYIDEDLYESLIDYLESLKDYLDDLQEFINWIIGEPWKDQIKVSGVVTLNAALLAGATVTCRGQSITTNSDGEFSFYIDPNPDEDSFPPNEWYGMHSCVITVSKDGSVLKETPSKLSYVFSGGEINWLFFIIKGKSKNTNLRTILIEKLNNILEGIRMLLPNFFRIINRVNIYSI